MNVSIMTVSMAGEEQQHQQQQQPVFHDFLGILSGQRGRKRKDLVATERDNMHKQNEKDYVQQPQQHLQQRVNSTPFLSSSSSKASQIKTLEEKDAHHHHHHHHHHLHHQENVKPMMQGAKAETPMLIQPPVNAASNVLNPHISNTNLTRPTVIMPTTGYTVSAGNERIRKQGNASTTTQATEEVTTMLMGSGNGRETALHPSPLPVSLSCTPSDEGSRTGGLRGGCSLVPAMAARLHTSHITPLQITPHLARSKSLSQPLLPDPSYVSSQPITPRTPTSKQLTIFYGGQAHVFEDVPSDKLEAIMDLAGSSGRSWSTTYNPRSKSSKNGSPSLMQDKDGEKSMNKPSACDTTNTLASDLSHHRQESAADLSSQQEKAGIEANHACNNKKRI